MKRTHAGMALAVIAALGAAGCATREEIIERQNQAYIPKVWQEGEVRMPPALPADGDLLEFDVPRRGDQTFFIDTRNLSLGADGVTRVPVVVRSSSGARSVTFEGFRCATGEHRIYAIGAGDEWAPTRISEWKVLHLSTFDPRSALMHQHLCELASSHAPERIIQKLRYPGAGWR